jgi:hypothetical protein
MKLITNIVTTLLFLAIVVLAPGVVHDALADQKAKADLANINHIMYGMFSVNAWKGQIADIVYAEIQNIDLKSATKKLKVTIEKQLTAVIDKLNDQIREANKTSLGGRIKQVLIDLVVDIQTVKKGVPAYADAMIAQITKPETEKAVKDMATKQLKKYLDKTFTEQEMDPVQEVLDRTGTATVPEASKKLNDEIDGRKKDFEIRSYSMMGAAAFMFALMALPRNRSKYTVTILFGTLIVLLGVGITIPMIDLEAKITEMSFMLIGHKVIFENQILYFQSKSVLNVFWLMMTHPDVKMKAVGVLLVLFSVVFPILKMGASIVYFFFEKTRNSRVVQFFAFKIGKWSMADVMVIAILMSYIGFNGIVDTQFDKMKALVPKDISFFTTNGTTLQMGYYIFITYVMLAMVLSSYVHATKAKSTT